MIQENNWFFDLFGSYRGYMETGSLQKKSRIDILDIGAPRSSSEANCVNKGVMPNCKTTTQRQ